MDDVALPLLLLEDAEAGATPEDLDEVVEPMEGFVLVEEDELPLPAPEVLLLTSLTLEELVGGMMDIVFVI